MLKIHFEELSSSPKSELTLYNSISRIPFTLKIGDNPVLSETIYARNLRNENFIEFRFDKNNKSLYEISLVSFQNETVENTEIVEINHQANEFYGCFIDELSSELENFLPIKILRCKTFISIEWKREKQIEIKYFPLSLNCLLGITPESYLTSVVLRNLSEKDIFDIFGF